MKPYLSKSPEEAPIGEIYQVVKELYEDGAFNAVK